MPAIAATTPPVAFVLRREEVIEEIARAVVVALVVVEFPVTMRLPLIVVEPTETNPALKVSVVEVALDGKRYPKVAILESTSAEVTVAQVAAPRASRERTNWLVQEVPVYSANSPVAPVTVRAEVREVTVRLVEVAVPATVRPPAAVLPPMVVEA